MTVCIVVALIFISRNFDLCHVFRIILITDRKSYMYQRNNHVKYQSSSTQCLKVSSKVKVFRQIYRMTERRNDRMTHSCKYRFYTKTPLASLCSKSFFRKYDKNNTFILANIQMRQVGEKNAERIYAEIVKI